MSFARTRPSALGTAVLLASAGLVLLVPAPTARATFPGRNGLIAFTSNSPELSNPQVYAIGLDGRGRRRVSVGLQGAEMPTWSPDGKTIAFVRTGFWSVMAASPTGGDARMLADLSYAPVWSPDGTKIAYGTFVGDDGLMVGNADGSDATQVAARTQPDARAAWSPDGRNVAFLRNERDARYGIYGVELSDRAESKLGDAAGADVCIPGCGHHVYPIPSWAPDGRHLVYTDQVGTRYRVVVLDSHTLTISVLLRGSGNAAFATWSPDGRHIALTVGSVDELRIALLDERGHAHTLAAPERASDLYPTWSPDGRLLAFVRRQELRTPSPPMVVPYSDQLYVLDTRTMTTRRVTAEPAHAQIGPPTWSPDGRALAYDSRLVANDPELFVRSPGGSEQALTNNVAEERDPAWSSDGRKLAFASDRDGDFEIYVVDSQGKWLTQLTHDRNVDETRPAWYPDGTRIAFTRRLREQNALSELWVMQPDGRDQRRLARIPRGSIVDVAWSPDGTALAYEVAYSPAVEVRVVQLDSGRSCNLGEAIAPVWSPDARLLEIAGHKGGLGVVTPDCRRAATEGVPPAGAFWPPYVWSPDGLDSVQAEPRTLDWQPHCTIEGTSGRDVIVGTPGDDVICAFDGNDVVSGGGGHDVVYGGPGNDRLVGDRDADWLFGGDGNDVLVAADGVADVVNGGPGRDRASVDAALDRAMGVEVRS